MTGNLTLNVVIVSISWCEKHGEFLDLKEFISIVVAVHTLWIVLNQIEIYRLNDWWGIKIGCRSLKLIQKFLRVQKLRNPVTFMHEFNEMNKLLVFFYCFNLHNHPMCTFSRFTKINKCTLHILFSQYWNQFTTPNYYDVVPDSRLLHIFL
jgi:hypothetical protein